MKHTVSASLRHEAEPVKGSRFIVNIIAAKDETQARNALAAVAAEYGDASHHCWALRLARPPIERSSDDGEPRGSAGRPILAQLIGRDLVDTLAVVTRYFGGTKLGVGGLVRAYGGATGQALDRAQLRPWIETAELRFSHDYAYTDAVERLVANSNGVIVDRTFATMVALCARLPATEIAAFVSSVSDLSAGSIVIPIGDNAVPS